MKLQIECPEVFTPLIAPSRYKGAHGGRGSGKSWFFADLLIARASSEPGFSAVCLREIQKSLKQSVMRLIANRIQYHGLGQYFDIQESQIKCPGGGIIIFQGMQNHTAESIKSLEGYDVAWVEEAQGLSKWSLGLLRPTIRKAGSEIWFSWNPYNDDDPVDDFLRGKIIPDGATVVEANYYNNPFFTKELRDEMEFDKSRDLDKYHHVWCGAYRKHSQARVFKNWRVEEFPEVGSHVKLLFGGDWGFSIDPSVLVRAFIWGRTLYISHEAHKVGCEIDYLPSLFAGNCPVSHIGERWDNPKGYEGVPGALKWPIVADSARPETIAYMNKRGFRIKSAVKGAGSVEDGIEFLKSFDIVVHPRCVNTIAELRKYSWKVDKKTEEVLPILEDKNNHVIDSLRYALESERHSRYSMDNVGD